MVAHIQHLSTKDLDAGGSEIRETLSHKTTGAEDGEMGHWLRTWRFTTVCNCSPRGADALFYPLWASGMHMVHRHIYKQRTLS